MENKALENLMNGLGLALEGLDAMKVDLPESDKNTIDEAKKNAKKEMDRLKKEIHKMTKNQSKYY